MPMTSRIGGPPSDSRLALSLLTMVGGFLALSVLLSKIAHGHGMPMLTYLAFGLTGSGAILLLSLRRGDRGIAPGGWLWGYGLVAGGLLALGSALGYLTIHVVGAAFISLAMALPPMMTWALSLLVGLERFDLRRSLGLLVALCGGILLATGKGDATSQAATGYVIAASAIPVILAVGNVFRTRYWPTGVDPRPLAALMLICGGALTFPVALWHEGPIAWVAFADVSLAAILLLAVVAFAAQYLLLFRLQQVAGPVYLSQIGSVAAVFGVPAAVFILDEPLPDGFAPAAVLIALGLMIFQSRNRGNPARRSTAGKSERAGTVSARSGSYGAESAVTLLSCHRPKGPD